MLHHFHLWFLFNHLLFVPCCVGGTDHRLGYRQQTLQNIPMYRSRPLSLIAMIPRGSSASRRLSLTANHLLSTAPSSSSSSSSPAQARVQGPRRLSTTTTTTKAQDPATMSSQPEHSTLLIPGPIEFDDAVLQSMSHYR